MSNVRPIPEHKIAQARAALQLLDGFERGTAILDAGGVAEWSAEHGRLFYRSLAGCVYPATMRARHADPRLVDLDVHIPGVHDPVTLTRIKLANGTKIESC